MRIIAGEFRGRVLREPKFDVTRPITDRAKQSLFDVLNPIIADAVIYDCFSGTGSMGLECLSRCARHSYFFEADRVALSGLRKNIAALAVADRSTVVAGDIFRLLETTPRSAPADLIFLDPPYRFLAERADAILKLTAELTARMSIGATLLFRHDKKDKLTLPGLSCHRTLDYGLMTIELLRVVSTPSSV